ncbi:MAG: hypothetical protein QOK26_4010, partial [Pseudonocardiales bacterium]|nr:hypothetical protein [Pseudonocardiales bacterium]
MPTPLHLTLEIDGDGAHPAAWRRAAHPPEALLTPQRVRAVAAIAENAGFTLVTLDDEALPPGRAPDPVGRAGWVVAESTAPESARAWGRPLVDGPAARAGEARDSVRVTRELWDSWEDDAVIRDVATSRYLDADQLHYI